MKGDGHSGSPSRAHHGCTRESLHLMQRPRQWQHFRPPQSLAHASLLSPVTARTLQASLAGVLPLWLPLTSPLPPAAPWRLLLLPSLQAQLPAYLSSQHLPSRRPAAAAAAAAKAVRLAAATEQLARNPALAVAVLLQQPTPAVSPLAAAVAAQVRRSWNQRSCCRLAEGCRRAALAGPEVPRGVAGAHHRWYGPPQRRRQQVSQAFLRPAAAPWSPAAPAAAPAAPCCAALHAPPPADHTGWTRYMSGAQLLPSQRMPRERERRVALQRCCLPAYVLSVLVPMLCDLYTRNRVPGNLGE